MLNNEINTYLGVFLFPLSSLEIIDNDLIAKFLTSDRNFENLKAARKQVLDYLAKYYIIKNEDEINLTLERWYLYPRVDIDCNVVKVDICDIMLEHLKSFSKSLITQLNGKIKYKYWKNENDEKILGAFSGKNKIHFYHSINRAMSLDILSMIYMVENNKSLEDLHLNYGGIEVSDDILDDILKNGVAENHMHVGVSGSFLSIWNEIMNPIITKTYKKANDFAIIFNQDSFTKNHSLYYLHLAGTIRILLSIIVSEFEKTNQLKFPENEDLSCLLDKVLDNITEGKTRNFCDDLIKKDCIKDYILDTSNTLTKTIDLEGVMQKGVIKTIFDLDLDTSNENIFLYKVLKLLKTDNNDKNISHIKKLFFTYLRIKNYFFNQLVQQKTVSGLIYFQKYYRKSSKSLKSLNSKNEGFWKNAILEQIQSSNIHKIEFRTSVEDTDTKARKSLKLFFKEYQEVLQEHYCSFEDGKFVPIKKIPRIGFVYHLLKKEQLDSINYCSSGSSYTDKLQFEELSTTYAKDINIIKKLRNIKDSSENSLGLDKFIVGLDIASLESAVPTWVYTDAYEKARDSSVEMISSSKSVFQSLKFTVHAGEDFRHILSGLRRIYESVIYLKFHSGDRIGHGIALGISPYEWSLHNKTIFIPRIEALHNYAWSYMLISQNMIENSLINISYLEKQIYKLFADIFGDNHYVNIKTIIDAYHKLHTERRYDIPFIKKCSSCTWDSCHETLVPSVCQIVKEKTSKIITAEDIIYAMHCKHFAYKMNEAIHLSVSEQDIIISEEVQKTTRKLVNEYGIIVEVNPSSNVVITDFDTIKNHQIYDINNHTYDFDNVLTCINSDDPSVFNTNVSNELGFIYFGMVERNVNRENIMQWIEKLRKTGMTASFIKDDNSDENFLKQIDYIVKNL